MSNKSLVKQMKVKQYMLTRTITMIILQLHWNHVGPQIYQLMFHMQKETNLYHRQEREINPHFIQLQNLLIPFLMPRSLHFRKIPMHHSRLHQPVDQ